MTKEELEEKLKESQIAIQKLTMMLDQITTPPSGIGKVVRRVSDNEVLVLAGSAPMRYKYNKDLGDLQRGDCVLISTAGKGIAGKTDEQLPGKVVPFIRDLENGFCEVGEVAGMGGSRMAWLPPEFKPEPGHNVVVDNSSTLVLADLGKPILAGMKMSEEFNVSWDDVGGLNEVRTFFTETFEHPILHPELYAKYRMKPPKGVLMSGPPGCGKSLVAKAVATSLSGGAQGSFISVKGPEILSPFVGMAEMKIREIFKSARDFYRANGKPAVVFIDECESVMNRRGSGRSSDVDRTIVPAFLTEMDGLEISGALVILATNRPELLDPAIIREGRIDKKVVIPRPSADSCTAIFDIHTRHFPLAKGLTRNELCIEATKLLRHNRYALYRVHLNDGKSKDFCLRDLVSGAMIEVVCQRAAKSAMSRDIKGEKPSGVVLDDIEAALEEVWRSNAAVSHEEIVTDFCEPMKDEVDRIVKLKPEFV